MTIWRYQLPSYLTSDSRSEPINFYNILVSDRHDLTLSIISYLLLDRRSDANTIHDNTYNPVKYIKRVTTSVKYDQISMNSIVSRVYNWNDDSPPKTL